MKTAHLTDTELQLYAAEPAKVTKEQSAHIHECPFCEAKAFNYGMLYKEIHDIATPAFDFDLSALVMDKLPQANVEFPFEKYIKYIVISIVGIVSLMISYSITPYFSIIFKMISPLLNCLIIICTACISVFLFADMYANYVRKTKILNHNYPLQQ